MRTADLRPDEPGLSACLEFNVRIVAVSSAELHGAVWAHSVLVSCFTVRENGDRRKCQTRHLAPCGYFIINRIRASAPPRVDSCTTRRPGPALGRV